MKKLVLETTAPFQGLPELVAYDEGLFASEGLEIEWADREQGVEKKVEAEVTSPKGVDPFASHGKLFEQGKADMYNACEWGNYCRVQDTGAGSRQLGRRAIIAYSALVVAPNSPVFTPQQLANKVIGVPFYFGTHYIALHMLEGFLPRDMIKLCRAPNGSRYRLDALMRGEVDATTLTEPHVTLAEKKGCRTICSAFFHRTEVASARVDAETNAAFNRAVREAVRGSTRTSVAICTISSITMRRRMRRSPRSRSRTCARAALSSVIPRPSPPTRCSAPTTGSRAGACWKIPLPRSSSSTSRCRATPIRRRSDAPRRYRTPPAFTTGPV